MPKSATPTLEEILLTPAERAALARALPTRTGSIAMAKRCGWCGRGLPATAVYCGTCAPDGKALSHVGGANLGQHALPPRR